MIVLDYVYGRVRLIVVKGFLNFIMTCYNWYFQVYLWKQFNLFGGP